MGNGRERGEGEKKGDEWDGVARGRNYGKGRKGQRGEG